MSHIFRLSYAFVDVYVMRMCDVFTGTVCRVCEPLPRREDWQHGGVDVCHHRSAHRHPHVLPRLLHTTHGKARVTTFQSSHCRTDIAYIYY